MNTSYHTKSFKNSQLKPVNCDFSCTPKSRQHFCTHNRLTALTNNVRRTIIIC